ncbi:uncharacterized protein LOC122856554 [Aphidius gifuensis]|uniref:uncharacterized protein LOC122856554 n=1 Tax=Aphidius gifuensis TaxID=684658 RepID=UPI001CDC24F5|nr:uncharacterized protein LOC122856554 [Aphidius gifuensis]
MWDSNVDVDGEGQLIGPVKKKSKAKKNNKNNNTKIDDIDDLTMDIIDEKLVAPVKRKLKVTNDKKMNVKEDIVNNAKKNVKDSKKKRKKKDKKERLKREKDEQLECQAEADEELVVPIKNKSQEKNKNKINKDFKDVDYLTDKKEEKNKPTKKRKREMDVDKSTPNKVAQNNYSNISKKKKTKKIKIAEEPVTADPIDVCKLTNLFQVLSGGIMTIMESGYYVDKTKYMQKLIEKEGCYLITRPRRFGKSVMLDTIAEICKGKDSKELFKNTAIGRSPTYQWKKYPVFEFNFAKISARKVKEFKYHLINGLKSNCDAYNIKYDDDSQSIKKLFEDMMKGGVELKNGYESKVVILIDEYDEPLYRSCEKKIENEITKIIQEFYSILTSYISKNKNHMVLITGAAKLYMTKIFNNSVNNIVDITLDKKVNAICGYTHSELITVFEDQLDKMCRELNKTKDKLLVTLKREYGGYKFCKFGKETIYNPWSILNFFFHERIVRIWQAKNPNNFQTVAFGDIEIMLLALKDPLFFANDKDLSQFNFDDKYDQISLESFLFQTGLLTIDNYNKETKKYTLKIPNKEAEELLEHRFEYNSYFSNLKKKNYGELKILKDRDAKVFIDCLQSNFCKWPYNNKQCESTAYHMYLCDVIQEIYQLTHELMTDKSQDACEPTREDLE